MMLNVRVNNIVIKATGQRTPNNSLNYCLKCTRTHTRHRTNEYNVILIEKLNVFPIKKWKSFIYLHSLQSNKMLRILALVFVCFHIGWAFVAQMNDIETKWVFSLIERKVKLEKKPIRWANFNKEVSSFKKIVFKTITHCEIHHGVTG